MRENNRLQQTPYKHSVSDLVPPWDSCNFYSEKCYCYNTFHEIQFKKEQLP